MTVSGAFSGSVKCRVQLQAGQPGRFGDAMFLQSNKPGQSNWEVGGTGLFQAPSGSNLRPGTYRAADLAFGSGVGATKFTDSPSSVFTTNSDFTMVLFEIDDPISLLGPMKTHGTVDGTLQATDPKQPTQGTVTLHVDF
jgi:hypothetical protein